MLEVIVPVVIVGGAVLLSKLSNSKSGGGSSTRWPEEFNPDYQHINIAIDTKSDRIWLRDKNGRSAVLDKSAIKQWQRNFTSVYHLGRNLEYDNYILVLVADLNHPSWEIAFKKHRDAHINSNQNAKECEEWIARLNAWINHS